MSRRFLTVGVAVLVAIAAVAAMASAQSQPAVSQQGRFDTTAARAMLFEAQQRQAALAAIAQDRASFVAGLMQRWSVVSAERDPGAKGHQALETLLMGAVPERLYRASIAESYEAFLEVLVGRGMAGDAVAIPSGDSHAPSTLGSSSSDLVYTAVTPCRVADSRFASAIWTGPWAANANHYLQVTDPIIAGQGGQASCGIPYLAAKGVVLNITAVGPWSYGDLRIFPFLGTPPNASILNFAPGQNIANAVVAPVCQGCNYELRIINDASVTDVIVDVLGYFAAPYATPLEMTTVTSAPAVVAENSLAEAFSPSCPTGYTMTGGGYKVDPIVPGLVVSQSSYDEGTGKWRVKVNNPTFVVLGLTVYGQCSRVPGR